MIVVYNKNDRVNIVSLPQDLTTIGMNSSFYYLIFCYMFLCPGLLVLPHGHDRNHEQSSKSGLDGVHACLVHESNGVKQQMVPFLQK
eukprot:5480579-Amphidinium_carterae.1